MKTEPGYEPLANVLQEALDQSQLGKGRERHANDKPFLEQPIMTEGRNLGPAGLAFQARKKIREALNCPDDERAIRDLLGAVNYTAAMVLLRREGQEKYLRENAAGREYALPPGERASVRCHHEETVNIDPTISNGYTQRCLICGAFLRHQGPVPNKPWLY